MLELVGFIFIELYSIFWTVQKLKFLLSKEKERQNKKIILIRSKIRVRIKFRSIGIKNKNEKDKGKIMMILTEVPGKAF